MEKILKQMPNQTDIKADRILEINPNHDIFTALSNIHETTPKKIDDYATLLYRQALLIEGYELDDPIDFSNQMIKLMVEASKLK